MIGRLLVGLVKGLVVGGLLGFAVAKLGFVAPGAVIAYLAAAAAGALVGLVAGKPIWAKEAKIEAGMKAVVGALLGAGLMFAIRKWLGFPLPTDLGALSAPNLSLLESGARGTIGGLAVTSLALVAAVLGGFYEVDNTPDADESKAKGGARVDEGAKGKARIGASTNDDEADDDDDVDVDPKRAKR
jgi:hypothetical protein